jgi:cell division septation protein DedD
VADLTHDTADDAFHEIQLSGKQLVFLFMATTVISVIIFICGVLVGRSVPVEGISAAEGPATTASAPADVPAPAEGAAPPPSTAQAAEGTSYSSRLHAQASTPEKLRPVAEPPPAPVAAEAPRPAPEATSTPTQQPPTRETAETAKPPAAQPGTWAVQVVSLRDRGAANQIVQRLQGRNYPAFLVAPSPGTPTQLYKVQVGKYKDRAEAERIQARLKKEEQFDPWIVR